MDLILWRHAEAEPGEPDLGRPLTAKGVRQAERIAAWLDGHLPDATPHSGESRRTRAADRARARARSSRPCREIAPGASGRGLCSPPPGGPTRREPVLIVGHQPTLGETAGAAASGSDAPPWSMRKGAVWWLSTASATSKAPQSCSRSPSGPIYV